MILSLFSLLVIYRSNVSNLYWSRKQQFIFRIEDNICKAKFLSNLTAFVVLPYKTVKLPGLKYEWDWGLNYCHNYRFMPGSIETEEDHRLITNFLNTSTDIADENRFLWLAATDHRSEGTFQWMWNMENVTVGVWAPGMPSHNRTANCLAINREGQFMEESCFESGRHYHTLCEAPNFLHGSRDVSNIQINQYDTSDAKTINQLTYQPTLAFTEIGHVGNKMYFADNQEVSWSESLDLCHSAEMRLATPEQPDQLDFIQEYARQQRAIYYLGGTDRLSVSCLRTNSEFRWFYTGNPVANQTNLIGGNFWYMCTFVTPDSGLLESGCAKGGGVSARTICEITIES